MAVRLAAVRAVSGSFLNPQVRLARARVEAVPPATPRVLMSSLRAEMIPVPEVKSDWYAWDEANNTWAVVVWHSWTGTAWTPVGQGF